MTKGLILNSVKLETLTQNQEASKRTKTRIILLAEIMRGTLTVKTTIIQAFTTTQPTKIAWKTKEEVIRAGWRIGFLKTISLTTT